MAPSTNGILESALYVEDLDRSVDFYETVLGLRSIFRNARMCAMSVADKQVLLLFVKGGSIGGSGTPESFVPGHDGDGNLHVAFSIAKRSVDEWRQRLADNDVGVESTVDWGRGGKSLYFRDPDNHSIELVTPGTWEIF